MRNRSAGKKRRITFAQALTLAAVALCLVAVLVVLAAGMAVRHYGTAANAQRGEVLRDALRDSYIALVQRTRQMAGAPAARVLLEQGATARTAALNRLAGESRYLLVRTDGQVVAANFPLEEGVRPLEGEMRRVAELLGSGTEDVGFSLTPLCDQGDTVCFAVGAVESGGEKGYLFLALTRTQFEAILSRAGSSEVLVIGEEGGLYATVGDPAALAELVADAADGSLLHYRGSSYVVHRGTVVRRMQVYTLRSLTDAMGVAGTIGAVGAAGALVLAAGFALWSILQRRREKRALHKWEHVAEQCRRMDLAFSIQTDDRDVDRPFYEIINTVMEQVRTLVVSNEELAHRRTQMEVKHLQGQFNPHFVFNLLANLQYMIRVDPVKASAVVAGLSRLLRYSVENGRTRVPLKTDLEYMEIYLMLQKSRFGTRLDYSIEIEPALLDCEIPKLLFQPLVENSIVHNIDKTEHLRITLTGMRIQQGLTVVVRDDGQGISPQRLFALRQLLEGGQDDSDHIGLYNVHRTIQLEYGMQYGVDLHSVYTRGTEITVTMPFVKGAEDG